jgi:NAD(P)H-hydrate epimerase
VKRLFVQRRAVILAGGGNNGGDGLVAARELLGAHWDVRVLLIGRRERLSPDCLAQLKTAEQAGVPVEFRSAISEKDLEGAVVVDAMLGTGLNKDIDGPRAKVVAVVNGSGSPVVSIDIPSGISSDSGQVMGIAVRAAHTVTFGLPKRGHLLHPGADYAGNLSVEAIGFPEELLTSETLRVELLERDDVSSLIPERPKYSHKGDYGHVLVVAGSRGKTGAALMAARACLRSGAGLVTLGVPESLMDVVQGRVTEEMVLPLPDAGNGTLSSQSVEVILRFLAVSADVLCIGPGLGVSPETGELLKALVLSSRVPMVIDADGINSLSDSGRRGEGPQKILKKASAPVILTPHPGEMARLLEAGRGKGKGTRRSPGSGVLSALRKEVEHDRVSAAADFAKETGASLVLKGVPTVIAEPGGGVFINSTGNPGMATAGSGDVLAGMISSFVAQGVDPVNSSVLGVFMHGLAGDLAARDKGMHSLIASDLIDSLPAAFVSMNGETAGQSIR